MVTDKMDKEGNWINNKTIIKSNLKKQKPCYDCNYCPYGQLVEKYPIRKRRDEQISCKTFGHDCPMFYQAEDLIE